MSTFPSNGNHARSHPTFHVYISHGGPDKHTIAQPLYNLLTEDGIPTFLDTVDPECGEGLPAIVERAMETAPIVIVILSPEFAARKWPMRQLFYFLQRAEKARYSQEARPILIPIFYRLSVEECFASLPFPEEASNVFAKYDFYNHPGADLKAVLRALREITEYRGITSDGVITNEDTVEMRSRREQFVAEIFQEVRDAWCTSKFASPIIGFDELNGTPSRAVQIWESHRACRNFETRLNELGKCRHVQFTIPSKCMPTKTAQMFDDNMAFCECGALWALVHIPPPRAPLQMSQNSLPRLGVGGCSSEIRTVPVSPRSQISTNFRFRERFLELLLGTASKYKPTGKLLPSGFLKDLRSRLSGAAGKLGNAVMEARLGLSRVLTPAPYDVELFARQLKEGNQQALEPAWERSETDGIPCFAISYEQQRNGITGRFKFSAEQWGNFGVVVKELSSCGVTQFRVWLDQCLWLRDANQESWVHIGVVPYVLWPVISLGCKRMQKTRGVTEDRTLTSYSRMWPFVEEIAGLWGMGLIIASEYRSADGTSAENVRTWVSYNVRARLKVEETLMVVLRNVFHGATDHLETGWIVDKAELKKMARKNIMTKGDEVVVGSNWQERSMGREMRLVHQMVDELRMPVGSADTDEVFVYLDGSAKVALGEGRRWHGIDEWLSGNELRRRVTEDELATVEAEMKKVFMKLDDGEYRLLGRCGNGRELWLIVRMTVASGKFSEGHVEWTKVMTGRLSRFVLKWVEQGNFDCLEVALSEQLERSVEMKWLEMVDLPISWGYREIEKGRLV